MKKIKILTIILLIISVLSIFAYFLFKYDLMHHIIKNIDLTAPGIVSIDIKEYNKENETYFINIKVKDNFSKKIYCYASKDVDEKFESKWQVANNNICEFELETTTYNLYIKDASNNITKVEKILNNKNEVFEIKLEEIRYIALDDTKKLNEKVISIGNDIEDPKYFSSNEDVATVTKEGIIKPKKAGETSITINIEDKSATTKVIVTDLITKAKINFTKSFLPCKKYTESDAKTLDTILKNKVDVAGRKTRAGVVAAARFLLLEFPYKISYFPENGRMSKEYKVDAEGRYYHEGLYLSEEKYDDIKYISTGPVMWGCPLKVALGEEDQPAGSYFENGLDCSGLVSWIMINGGFDFGDIGAGFSSVKNFSNLAERKEITVKSLKSNTIKAGDLIGYDGHIGIIVGIDEKNVYVGDTLNYQRGATVRKFSYQQLSNYSYFTYIVPMDEVYKNDGNYTDMW